MTRAADICLRPKPSGNAFAAFLLWRYEYADTAYMPPTDNPAAIRLWPVQMSTITRLTPRPAIIRLR